MKKIKSYLHDFLLSPVQGLRNIYWKTAGYLHCLAFKKAFDQQYDKIHEDLMEDDKWMLIVLDAARYDYFLSEAKIFFEDSDIVESVYSSGRDTAEYSMNTWDGYHQDVKYVSGAVPVSSKLSEEGADNEFHQGYVADQHLDIFDAWEVAWDDDLGAVLPEDVRKCAENRLGSYDQMVVHFFQPHGPYIGEKSYLGYTGDDTGPGSGNPSDEYVWHKIENGEITDRELKEMYRSNLKRVLGEVVELLEQVDDDRRVVITGDHGEMLGESGLYAHDRINHPLLRKVPWLEVQ